VAGRRPPGPRRLRGRELYRKVARLTSATEHGRVGAKAALGQRELDQEMSEYGAAFDAKPFDGALLSLLALVNAYCAPWLRMSDLHTGNRASLWLFGFDWQVDHQAQTSDEVDDLVSRTLAIADGGEAGTADGLGTLLARIRAELAAKPAFALLAPAWREELARTVAAMAREHRWRVGPTRPTVAEYLDNADNLGLAFVFSTLLVLDGAPPQAWQAGPGTLREAVLATQQLLRFINDVGTRKREAAYGDLNVLELGLTQPAVDAQIADRTRRCLELYATLRRHEHGIPRHWVSYLERVLGFNVGLYGVADYWGRL
jgi:hypothetical protein